MNIKDAFANPIFLLPKLNDKETFPLTLENIFEKFFNVIDTIDEGSIVDLIKQNRNNLNLFCEKILQTLNTYYLGFPSKAYFEFEEAIHFIEEFLFPAKAGSIAIDSSEPYYRARPGESDKATPIKSIMFSREEMFHVPFDKREFVTTKRFSIPGLPCLYLTNSIYTCWEELQRPDIEKMQVSRLNRENYALNILDLSFSPDRFEAILRVLTSERVVKDSVIAPRTLDSFDRLSIIHLMRWPLIAACSIKVKERQGTFKPEYIIPQFLLQWVRLNKSIDGIKYFSIEANINPKGQHSFSNFANYAIPTKEIKAKGYCPILTKSFSITESVSFENLKDKNPNIMEHDSKKFEVVGLKLGFDNMGATLLIDENEVMYWHTIFGKLEIELADMPFEKISSD